MSVPTAGRRHLVLVGATGMVGGYALRYALEHPAVERVTAIGRRTLGISHAKLVEVLRPNFGDCSALAESLSHQDAAIFCLGAYSGAVPDAEFRAITVDYVVEFTRVLHSSSPHAGFAFLSGKGTDPTGKSRIAFARYKGEAENALLTAWFPAVYIFRPAYIYPVEPRTEPNFGYRLLRAIYPVFRVLFPSNPSRRFGTGDNRCRTTSSGGPQRIGVREQRYPGHGREASPPHRVRRHRDIVEMDSAILSTTSALAARWSVGSRPSPPLGSPSAGNCGRKPLCTNP
jgi:hypothetical protein